MAPARTVSKVFYDDIMNLAPSIRDAQASLSTLAALVQRVNLYDLVERHAGAGRQQGRTITYQCPNPDHPDRSPSFTVTTTATGKQVAKCWSQCEFSGDALDFIAWHERLSKGDAARWLRQHLGEPRLERPMQKIRDLAPRTADKAKPLLDDATRPSESVSDELMRRYLTSRGWPASVEHDFSLEVIIDKSNAPRVRHPYFSPTSNGERVMTWYQDRAIHPGVSPKWMAPHGHTPTLYNVRSLEADTYAVIICEGAPDVITTSLALKNIGGIGVIGVPGVQTWQDSWSKVLTNKRVIIAVDNDEAGHMLESKIRASVEARCIVVRVGNGDITDTVRKYGLDKVRELFIMAAGVDARTETQLQSDTLATLLEAFPGSSIVGAS